MHRLLICPPDALSPALWRHVQGVYTWLCIIPYIFLYLVFSWSLSRMFRLSSWFCLYFPWHSTKTLPGIFQKELIILYLKTLCYRGNHADAICVYFLASTPAMLVDHYEFHTKLRCHELSFTQIWIFNLLFNRWVGSFSIWSYDSGVTTMGSDRADPGAPNPNRPNGGPKAQAIEQKHRPGRPLMCYNVVFWPSEFSDHQNFLTIRIL
jgi:hypothetical protein